MNHSSQNENTSNRFSSPVGLTLRFVISTFLILLLDLALSFGILVFLQKLGILSGISKGSLLRPLILLCLISIILGTALSLVFTRHILAPIEEVIRFADELASGNFNVRINVKGAREVQELTRSFNHMAEELGSLEMLRSDFVNNFSHEFKTPISSIKGFAKMLQREDLTPEERREYLEIIVNESERLTDLATNVLNLSKIETQTILTGQTVFNCSEQIRQIIALLEPKWSKKCLHFFFECDELEINANSELLEQVWINLLDNAIKFSPVNSVISLLLRKRSGCILLTITDCGPGIRSDTEAHIFDKFYQGDTSHTVAGNGLGLTIAQKIIELHKGTIRVAKTGPSGTTFEVMIPAGMPDPAKP
ncbi:MAG: HAMP domain-containing sensor histidine kinase [Candidatus Limivivens sp.]|nr:HAMP domain-containing sensor histidine kinase [Candidatus Limivivens sp.]